MADPKPLSRAQLAKFLPDEESIRRFEQAFNQIQNGQTSTAELFSAIAGADGRAAAALAVALQALAKAIPAPSSPQQAHLDFPSGAQVYPAPRRLWWSSDAGTHQIGLTDGVTGDLCQQLDFYVKNTSGGTISKGQSVMATGAVGASGKITVAPADADGSILSQYMLGIAAHDIPNNAFGYVVSFGSIRNVNTTGSAYGETWADGDVLFFHPSTAGGLTKTRPTAPALDLPVAIVTNASAGAGSLFVRMKSGETMNELHDVHAPSPTAGNLLIYDATQGRWEAANLTAGSNVTITNADGAITIAFGSTGYTGSFAAGSLTVTVVNGLITGVA
jgi:hypothetical protein